MTAALESCAQHLEQPREAIEVYKFLQKQGYKADFGLRFVWVSAVSALDHYISELIVEKSVEMFNNEKEFSAKMMGELVPLSSLLRIRAAPAVVAIVEFKSMIAERVRYRSFQKAADIADGLAMIWHEAHKWKAIAAILGIKEDSARKRLNGIVVRRDAIVHNADYDPSSGELRPCILEDAEKAVEYIRSIVVAIDGLVASAA